MALKKPFSLFENVKTVIAETQRSIFRNINQAMLFAYFQIGRMIVEDEQPWQFTCGLRQRNYFAIE